MKWQCSLSGFTVSSAGIQYTEEQSQPEPWVETREQAEHSPLPTTVNTIRRDIFPNMFILRNKT